MSSVQNRIDHYSLTAEGRAPYATIISQWGAPTAQELLKVTILFFGVIATIGLVGSLRFKLKQKGTDLAENVNLITVCACRILFEPIGQRLVANLMFLVFY